MTSRERSRVAGFECVACGATEARRWRFGGGAIGRCVRCGLLATWPQPNESTLTALYDAVDYHQLRSDADREAWRTRAGQVLAALSADAEPVLDYGAGPGHLVSAARSLGFEMDGLEPSANSRQLASQEYGIELLPRLPPVAERRYGGVTMLHVLEHLRDPVADLEALRNHLRTDATAFIEVPHAGSADLWAPRARQAILDLPLHLFHFTPATLAHVLSRAGYEVLDVRVFNSALAERLLDLRMRARSRAPAASEPHSSSSPGQQAGVDVGRLGRRAVADLRKVLPGGKFQVMARPSG